jgi:hypothetical protein
MELWARHQHGAVWLQAHRHSGRGFFSIRNGEKKLNQAWTKRHMTYGQEKARPKKIASAELCGKICFGR